MFYLRSHLERALETMAGLVAAQVSLLAGSALAADHAKRIPRKAHRTSHD